jgi:uncharacterized protein YdiU (UPF0061 family)
MDYLHSCAHFFPFRCIGVCNTDNFSLLAITIDYGPFGFMEEYNPSMTFLTSQFQMSKIRQRAFK